MVSFKLFCILELLLILYLSTLGFNSFIRVNKIILIFYHVIQFKRVFKEITQVNSPNNHFYIFFTICVAVNNNVCECVYIL